MNPAEKEVIEVFCRELALALRRVTGKKIDIPPAIPATQLNPGESSSTTQNSGEAGGMSTTTR